jgi:hypothetical protein
MFATLIILQIILIIYFGVTTTVDLHPFNAIRHYTPKERAVELSRNLLFMAIFFGLTLIHTEWSFITSGVCWILYFVGGGLTWWVPYLTGKEVFKLPNNETWPQMYNRIFAGTITVLPSFKDPKRPTPNLEHTILHSLMLGIGVLAIVAGVAL